MLETLAEYTVYAFCMTVGGGFVLLSVIEAGLALFGRKDVYVG
jgi:hypothetical protein